MEPELQPAREPVPAPPPFDRDGRLREFRYVRTLGHGGMADAYLAERGQGRLLQRVVVKVPRGLDGSGQGRLSADEVHRIVETEACCLLTLSDCFHIVRLLDFGESDGRPYLILEYLKGRALEELLAGGGRQPLAEVAAWVKDIASALDFAHARQVFHRDVTPRNLMYDGNGRMRLLDFGIARLGSRLDEAAGQTDLTRAWRSRPYSAPELHRDTREADLYSLAVTAYHALAGHCPWDDFQQQDRDPIQITQRCNDLPVGLDEVFARALTRSPAERRALFASCAKFAAMLDQVRAADAAIPRAGRPRSTRSSRPTAVTTEAEPPIVEPDRLQPSAVGGAESTFDWMGGTEPPPTSIPGFVAGPVPAGDECRSFVHEATGVEFLLVEGGTLDFGDGADARVVSRFLLARSPCTFGQFAAFGTVEPRRRPQLATEPVELVSWLDAMQFCGRFGWTLPTEVQWEHACRSGGEYEGLPRVLPRHRRLLGSLVPVADTPRNRWGFVAMFGGVFEWCLDQEAGRDRMARTFPFRILRGSPACERSSHWSPTRRQLATPGTRLEFVGFRPAMSLPPAD